MKKILLSTAALVATAGAALAGGVAAPVMEPIIAPVVVAQAPVGAWQGGYAGANLSWGKVGADGYEDLDGAGIGLRGGYDWQNGNTVFGLGADYDFGKQKADIGGGVDAQLKNAGSIFARLGYDANGWLPYASLGYTWAKAETTDGTFSENVDGYTIGLGVERKFTPNWAGYAEISHTDFGNVEALGVDADMQKVKLGVNYRF